MLTLDDPAWERFSTFYGTPADVPRRIAAWRTAIGGADESARWSELWELFLHQFTITDAAYAAVPHVVAELPRIPSRGRFDYLIELALIESARRKTGAPPLMGERSDDYQQALAAGRHYAADCLSLDLPKVEFRYLLSAVASLFGHDGLGDMLFHLDCISDECANCGETAYPTEIQASGYV